MAPQGRSERKVLKTPRYRLFQGMQEKPGLKQALKRALTELEAGAGSNPDGSASIDYGYYNRGERRSSLGCGSGAAKPLKTGAGGKGPHDATIAQFGGRQSAPAG